ncbi:neurofilament heavy polypeptide isoform X1 [Trichoplusia ni]|uniref:Neurofilament heavy polypeptide isoform X1 n=1 Tax=Trichoplusia ni TaxID=7111 RepID=A0A7E5V881_TRINI|nr:neurofilament heavy polypeptide isoform X1 [Trichoplusia ni]XP_026724491.1 neurofilament heavy polypeptide isoform X1 [Trichoplusia ni]XP_026724492.1 neurofilament heavy polypeptide isoform X1 [Trichoplusia ni]
MKIPESTSNVGAYYGNDENGQWQPNGVIIDSGVGGGVVGSGDAGIHRPPIYPVHIPRGHPGYVMAGAYYPAAFPAPPQPQDDFADYMWMENEEEFDKQVMQQLEEEALMEQCIEAMLEDEQRERLRPNGHQQQHFPTTSNGASSLSLEETVSRSTLNPLAAEFVPTRARQPPATEERAEPSEAPAEEPQKSEEAAPEPTPQDPQETTEEPVQPQKDPPEVSAADLDKSDKRKERRDSKPKVEVQAKKPSKVEAKPKAKPQTVKSETKVVQKKKEVVKSVKSDTKVEEKVEEVPEKPQPAPVEESTAPSGFKPVNYAAAAKANKPKKPSPPVIDKPAPQPKIEKTKTIEKIEKKEKAKTEKVSVQRKNSTK